MKNTGDNVYINGKEYILGEKIGGGVEGSVYNLVGNDKYVIKIINTSNLSEKEIDNTKSHLFWLKNEIGNNKELKSKMAIPKGILDNDLGYVMAKANEHTNLKSYLTYPEDGGEFQVWYKENYKLKKRLQIIANLFRSLEMIHISGLLFTDLSPNNIMVHKTKNNIVFIDTDNMRRKSDAYLSVLGTPGYMAPEIYNINNRNPDVSDKEFINVGSSLNTGVRLSAESDIFSAAVIAFWLLTLQHPYVGDEINDGSAEDEEKALKCMTDYILYEKDGIKTNESTNLPFVSFLENCITVTPEIKELFRRTFVEGRDNPYLRPTAIEFAEAFDSALDKVVKCPYCGAEYIYYYGKKNICWDCEKESDFNVVFEIHNRYEESDRDKLVDNILNVDCIDDRNKNSNFVCLSKIVLQENEDKFIYLRHFEHTIERSKFIAKLRLIDKENQEIEFQVFDNQYIKSCKLIDKKNQHNMESMTSVDRAKIFRAKDYGILFEINDSRIGTIRTVGSFRTE